MSGPSARRLAIAAGFVLAMASATLPAIAADLPARRAGLWGVTMTGGPGGAMHMEMQNCADPAREKADAMFTGGQARSGCQAPEIGRLPGGGVSFHAICTPPGSGMTVDTRGTATGDFNGSYVVRTTSRMDPAPMPSMAQMSMVMNARWLGACPAGMKPGDSKLNGRLLHGAGG